ncbi:HAUS augmin-like complex subunit 3 [Babylonia areolata]|uniref:HAUS augmin-like complex subunit 3 n=1 Tax=Babylonia areolata TaxID=304850 RepID=UPI003FD09101
MSGQQFIETLKQIGYPKAQALSPRGFDWMFEDEAVLPFLSWFCNSVGHQNVLSEEEKKGFAELEQSGDNILEGPVLDEALNCLSSDQDDAISLEALQEDVERMKDDLERHQKRKEKLVKMRNSLSLHHTGLTHRLAKFGDVEAAKKQEYRKSMEKCHRTNAECNASLQRLGESVQQLCSLYNDQGRLEKTETLQNEAVFLSQLSLDSFNKAEESYSRELTSFTKKRFFEGIADIAGGELSRYQLLEASDPTSLLVKGQSQETFQQDCQELARLQAVFPKSEGERINALVEAKCAANVSAAADDILRKLQAGQFPSDIQEWTRQTQETNQTLNTLRGELKRLTEGEVGELVRELGRLQGNQVLTGDYKLKLTRQDYFITNQDQVIKYLVNQRARNEFLTMAYEVEARNHREVHRLLTAVQKTLHEQLTLYQSRMQAMDDPSLTKAKYERSTIDTRDAASTCLHQMLVPANENPEQRQLFLSFSSMVKAAESLKQSQSQAKAEAICTADKYKDKVQKLESEVEQCEEVLYTECSTVGGQPMLMPRQLLEATTQLDDMLHKLEAAILDTVTDVGNKKKALKKDILQTKERELFTYFHLHPERLKQTVDNLEKRLQAHSVK